MASQEDILKHKSLPTGVALTNTLKGNARNKLLIIGKTGTGKSSLCNVICGHSPKADIFNVSAGANSCTQRTQFADVNFNKDKGRPISLIDTIGFDDPDKDDDAEIIAELVVKLKHDCDYINQFVIAVNGQQPRLDGSLLGMIKIFEGMFGQDFWHQVVVLFTRMPMSKFDKSRREKNSNETDDQLAKKYMKEVAQRFRKSEGIGFLFLDACYDNEDPEETKSFNENMEALYKKVDEGKALPTIHVTEIETRTAALQRQIDEKEKERKEAQQQLQQMLKKWKKEREELEERAKEKNKQIEKKFKDFEEKEKEKGKMNEAERKNHAYEKKRLEEERANIAAQQKSSFEELSNEMNQMRLSYENKGYAFGDMYKILWEAVKDVTNLLTLGKFKKKLED